jgi:moderate conductance mechanosensitive channel
MSTIRANSMRAAVFIGVLLVAFSSAVAQVRPPAPQLPIPAPSEAKKSEGEKNAAGKLDEAKSETAKADEKNSDTGKKSVTGTRADEKKPDLVRDWIYTIRSWSLPGFLAWLRDHGFNIVLILVLSSAILWLANRFHKRLVVFLAGGRGTAAEQENRARTLVGVMHNALRTVVIATAVMMMLDEIGLSIGALLGGVAVVGLAVAFGAQSLIKDYFTGFLVLLEQQYMIGDVVKISGNNFSGVTGQVEQITLRVTVLRDVEGAVHFIPHGQITVVSNLTHGWSQAVFDVKVECAEHVERVRDLFFELAAELRTDSTYGPMILNDPEMLGVDSLSDNNFTVKFTLKTLPLKRWEVKREMLRRIKEKFQVLTIKVSVPA